jgi:hypothetical protein
VIPIWGVRSAQVTAEDGTAITPLALFANAAFHKGEELAPVILSASKA